MPTNAEGEYITPLEVFSSRDCGSVNFGNASGVRWFLIWKPDKKPESTPDKACSRQFKTPRMLAEFTI